MKTHRTSLPYLTPLALALALVLAACYRPAPPPTAQPALPTATPLPGGSADVRFDGSSLVAPITEAVTEGFKGWRPDYTVAIESAGTSSGFARMCRGETDLVNAARAITGDEITACARSHIDWLEVITAYDVLIVAVNPEIEFVECLTIEELRMIWSDSDRKDWAAVREGFPTMPLTVVEAQLHPAQTDLFNEAAGVVEVRADLKPGGSNPAAQMAETPGAVGYLDYGAYRYAERDGAARAVAVDAGLGCITPKAAHVWDGTYGTLARPLYLYINAASLQRPAVRLFVQAYLGVEGQTRIAQAGYMPAAPEGYTRALAAVEARAKQ